MERGPLGRGPSRRGFMAGAAAVGALSLAPVARAASDYPNKPIRLIMPFPPGGGIDLIARLVMEQVGVRLGQPIVIDNRDGGTGVVGTELAKHEPADGYTLLAGNLGTMSITPNLDVAVPYDPVKDFVGVGMLTRSSTVLAVHPSLPANTLTEFVELAKAKPGELNYAGSSPATMLPMELLKSMAGIDVVRIPYKGAAEALNDLIGGHVDAMFGGALATIPHVLDGRLRALAVAGSSRTKALPDIPTVAESGYPGYAADSWNGVFAPAGTPAEILDTLNAAMMEVIQSAEVQERLDTDGAEPGTGTAAEFTAYVAQDNAKWATIITDLKAKGEI